MSQSQDSPQLIRVNWAFAFMIAAFFDVVKILLAFVPVVGEILPPVAEVFATFCIWFILKWGGVPTPWKDIRFNAVWSFIPIADFFQFWTIKMLFLRFRYKKVNAERLREAGDESAASAMEGNLGEELERASSVGKLFGFGT